MTYASSITSIVAKDVRFPTSKDKHGSDAMHSDPEYSCCYVIIKTNSPHLEGHGLTFTIGKGTEVVVKAVETLSPLAIGTVLEDIFNDFASFWRKLSSHSQIRWIGPEKGVIHLAMSAIVNGLWDLWAKLEQKPLWKLLVDMEPEKLVSTIDFRYISDVLCKDEAISILRSARADAKEREERIRRDGYPAYTTSVGWIGYSDEYVRESARKALEAGYDKFKIKIGNDIEDDLRRLKLVREVVGQDSTVMVDANQKWEVMEAVEWMLQLAKFQPLWIEEPTSPDDIIGNQFISKALKSSNIGVALGEQCHNRVIFKQLLQLGAVQFCQIDATRLGGVNEVIAVVLMAAKYKVPVCPHAGGVGLCEYVQHISIWDYVSVSGDLTNRMAEYVDHLHEHFQYPAKCSNGRYLVPNNVGYCGVLKPESIESYEFPDGKYWQSN